MIGGDGNGVIVIGCMLSVGCFGGLTGFGRI